jgi:hypothetical protein
MPSNILAIHPLVWVLPDPPTIQARMSQSAGVLIVSRVVHRLK